MLLPAAMHAATISGVVTSGPIGSAEGTPVTGAKVVLGTSGGGGGTAGAALDSAITAADGAFTFTMDTTGIRLLTVTAAGFNSGTAFVNVAKDSAYTANVKLTVEGAVGSISGKITSGTDSAAVSGATVIVRRQGGGTGFADTTVTSAQGEYAFDSVPENTGYTVSASATGLISGTRNNITISSAAPATANINLTVETFGALSGKITSGTDSAAVSGAVVIVRRQTGGGGTGYADTTETNAQGEYAFASVPVNTGYTVSASATGLVTGTRNNIAIATATPATANIHLSAPIPPGSVAGKVSKASDASALAGAIVIISRSGGGGGGGFSTDTAVTDAGGEFEFDSIPNNSNYTVTVSATGFSTTLNNNVDVAGGLATTVNFALSDAVEGDTTGTIKGVVTNATSKAPVADAIVILTRTGTGGGAGTAVDTVTTNAQGEYSFDSLATGRTYRVNATSATLNGASNNVTLAAGAVGIADFTLAVSNTGIVSSKVFSRPFQSRWVNGSMVLEFGTSRLPRSVEIYAPNGALKYRVPVAPGSARMVLPSAMTPVSGALLRMGK